MGQPGFKKEPSLGRAKRPHSLNICPETNEILRVPSQKGGNVPQRTREIPVAENPGVTRGGGGGHSKGVTY